VHLRWRVEKGPLPGSAVDRVLLLGKSIIEEAPELP
jgi:hypothetical protein